MEMTIWINKVAHNNNYDNLLFCARDMKLVQEIYSIYYGNSISNEYFYVSRKSTYLPYLYLNPGFEYFCNLIPETKKSLSINEILGLFNIKIDNLEDKLDKYKLVNTPTYDANNIKKDENFIEFYNNVICKYIKKEGKNQYDNFIKYLKKLNMSKQTAIVDLGWRGNTQKFLIDILKHNVNGIYLGLVSKDDNYLKNNYETYLFDGKENEYHDKILPLRSILELLFSALHGSTIGYINSSVKPYVLNKSIIISNIQKGALDFNKDFRKYFNYLDNNENSFLYIKLLIELGLNPTLKQANEIGEIYTENLETRCLAKPKSLIKYILNFKSFKNDFLSSEWKIGFLKRLFKIKLPYFKIYSLLKKVEKR